MTRSLARSTAGFVAVAELRMPTSAATFGDVDAVLAFASFEARSLAITHSAPPAARVAAVCRFQPPTQDNGRLEAANAIASHLQSRVRETNILELPASTEVDEVQERIRFILRDWYRQIGRPFVLGLDVSCCPKIYIAAVLSYALSTGIASGIVIHYAEADYSAKRVSSTSDRSRNFTDGAWRPSQVPYLEGEFVAGRARHAIVSMGEDAPAVEKLIRRYDPESITLLRPVPGVDPTFQQNTEHASRRIRELYGLVEVYDANPFSAVAALDQVHAICRARAGRDDLMAFLFGTKPHAVAICLAGIAHPQLQVIFRVPQRYKEDPVLSNGWSWLYSVKDTSNPSLLRSVDNLVPA